MKKAFAIVLSLVTLLVFGGWSTDHSSQKSDDFNLIEYLDTHKVQSLGEFQEVIEHNTNYSIPRYSLSNISDYDINIDYDNSLICVTTIGIASNKADVSNSASKDYYNDNGMLIFSISVSGTFRYSYYSCTVLTKSGGFTRPAYSYWSSTPTIGSGNFSATEAYVGISGTAVNGGSSYNYSLILICDNNGNFSTY